MNSSERFGLTGFRAKARASSTTPTVPRSVVVGAVQNAQRADAIVIEVAAEDDGLGLERGVAAFEQSRHVVGIGAAALAQDGMQFDARIRVWRRTRARTGVDRGLHVGGLLAGGGEEVLGESGRRW